MIHFWIEAKLFDTEFGPAWRGRASNTKRELNFKLPLRPDVPHQRAELAVVYEVLRTLPSVVNPYEEVCLHVSQGVDQAATQDVTIMNLVGDIVLSFEVNDDHS